jgi:hypothetical protein
VYEDVYPFLHWRPYSKDKFPGINVRNLEHWVKIGGAEHSHRHIVLGERRLLTLLSKTKNYTGEDPILDYLHEHGIGYDPDVFPVPSNIKKAIDALIFTPRSKPISPAKLGLLEAWNIFLGKISEALDAEELPEFEDEKVDDAVAKLQQLLKKRET